jgi:hypothetical protein
MLKIDEVEIQVGVEDQMGLKRWKVLRKLREYQLKWTTMRCVVGPGVSQADSATVTADCGEYKNGTYVLAILLHILNTQTNS